MKEKRRYKNMMTFVVFLYFSYLWMAYDHTIFTDIYTMFETKLICYIFLWTFTESHDYLFILFVKRVKIGLQIKFSIWKIKINNKKYFYLQCRHTSILVKCQNKRANLIV